ncbi:MotA/TolQ/ExbB proton channel family protein [Sphingobacterium sp. SYP-B4668]|uniref:MotA/TolQ/ExbB proton channel family protein n=1 Tax=Sphingobacterium sp. SYP-B4668 TaxID=2996035 RepID=UPI0022DDB10E|nr:MotA/TolQ/ExbB proton channel family protein [Sphingobacterium sp. SYP-B4668]
MLTFIEHILFQLANWLHLPVFLGLLAMVCWVVWSCGAVLREALNRKGDSRVNAFFEQNSEEIRICLADKDNADINVTELVQKWERKENEKLDRIRFLIKVAPSLGLVGTLIPMGQALATLSTGDMSAMANHMVVAFTATIVGLACGIVAYMITLKKEQWLAKDFLACEVLLERQLRKETDDRQLENRIQAHI